MQVLLDLLEEQLYLLAFFIIQFSDRCRRNLQLVGHKFVGVVGLDIEIHDLTVCSVNALQLNLLIQLYSRPFPAPALLAGNCYGIAFESGDKADLCFRELLILFVIGVATVENSIGPLGQIDKGRQITVCIQADMQLGCSFALAVFSLREQGQQEVNQRRIKEIELLLECEPLSRCAALTANEQPLKQGLVHL